MSFWDFQYILVIGSLSPCVFAIILLFKSQNSNNFNALLTINYTIFFQPYKGRIKEAKVPGASGELHHLSLNSSLQ